jgi:hypothetical protein
MMGLHSIQHWVHCYSIQNIEFSWLIQYSIVFTDLSFNIIKLSNWILFNTALSFQMLHSLTLSMWWFNIALSLMILLSNIDVFHSKTLSSMSSVIGFKFTQQWVQWSSIQYHWDQWWDSIESSIEFTDGSFKNIEHSEGIPFNTALNLRMFHSVTWS